MPPNFRDEQFQRELDELKKEGKAMNSVLVDLQVRTAQLEAHRPVGKDEFDPIKRLVWGFVSTVLAVVVVALLAIVINKTGTINIKP